MATPSHLVGLSAMLSALATYVQKVGAMYKAGRLTPEGTAKAFVVVETRLRAFAGRAAKAGLGTRAQFYTPTQAAKEAANLVRSLAVWRASQGGGEAVKAQPSDPSAETSAEAASDGVPSRLEGVKYAVAAEDGSIWQLVGKEEFRRAWPGSPFTDEPNAIFGRLPGSSGYVANLGQLTLSPWRPPVGEPVWVEASAEMAGEIVCLPHPGCSSYLVCLPGNVNIWQELSDLRPFSFLTEAPAQPEPASKGQRKASNYTLVGGSSQSFLLTLALVGRDAWSSFHTKHGDWAISLDDEADLPRPGVLPDDVEVLEYGEMTFSFDDMARLCPGLKKALATTDEGSANHGA